ncbi:Fur family transcriptional regulator [Angustibacter aerolatus]
MGDVPTTLDATHRLRARGLRVTGQRVAVLGVLDDAGSAREHLTASDVAVRTRTRLGTVSLQAVYDCLDAMTAAGLVRRFEPAGSAARFESRVGDNHHHLVCRACGRTVDVDCVVGDAACLTPSAAHGFAVDEAEVVFWGTCPDCTTAPPAAPQPAQQIERETS